LNGRDVEDLGDQLERATIHERLSGAVSGASENATIPYTPCDSTRAVGTKVDGKSDEQEVYQKVFATLLGADAFEAESRTFDVELHIVEKHYLNAERVFGWNTVS
jgi:hypothetical protein